MFAENNNNLLTQVEVTCEHRVGTSLRHSAMKICIKLHLNLCTNILFTERPLINIILLIKLSTCIYIFTSFTWRADNFTAAVIDNVVGLTFG